MTKATNERASEAEVLVTGATGLVGRWLLASLTRRGVHVAALVRGAAAREEELARFVARLGGDPARLTVVEGDVERPGLGLAVPLPRVRVVHHLAARFAFGLSRQDARRANVEGTRHVIAWAAAQPRLDRFVFLGGYRMTTVDLAKLDDAAIAERYRAGAYEGSKFEAYALFRRLAEERGIPWSAVHPSGLVGDSRTGETTQLVGLGETVQKLFEGHLPALAGTERTFVPVVTVDYLADYLATVPERAESAGQDLVVFDPASPPLGELVRMLAGAMGVAAPTRTVPVGLLAALPSAWTGVHRESTRFLSEDRYDTRAGDAHAAAMGLAHPPLATALARWCAYLVSSRFLAAHGSEIGRFVDGSFAIGDARTSEVVLLHGIPFDAEAMAPLARALGGVTARIDLPGLGRLGPGAIDEAWLGRMLGARARPVVLVGHSLGAGLAVRYAATHPERVAALVLVAPAFLAKGAPWLFRLRAVVARVLGGLDAAAFERRMLPERAPGGPLDATRSATEALARRGAPRRYADALADAVTPSSRDATYAAYVSLRDRGVPVLLVHARAEPLVRDPRGAEVVCVDDAGHNPQLTHTSRVASAIRAFVRREPCVAVSA